MNDKLDGIILRTLKYKDKSVIAYLYTNKRGRQTYIINSIKTPLHVLMPIRFEASGRKNAEMAYIKEYHCPHPVYEIITDVKKTAVAMFMGELLYKTLRDEDAAGTMYDFVLNSVSLLNHTATGSANFHLYFMVKLAKYLGFSIPLNRSEAEYFDMKSGAFSVLKPRHPLFFDRDSTSILTQMSVYEAAQIPQIQLTREQRSQFAASMVNYFSIKFDHVMPLKSLAVLHELFTD